MFGGKSILADGVGSTTLRTAQERILRAVPFVLLAFGIHANSSEGNPLVADRNNETWTVLTLHPFGKHD
jgi:hypothetical protein